MRHIKLFEDFDYQDPDLMPGGPKPKTFLFFVTSGENEEFSGEVRSETGKNVCSIDQTFLDDGIMQHETDISGLRTHLVDKKKIKPQDELKPAERSSMTSGEEMSTATGHDTTQLTIPIV